MCSVAKHTQEKKAWFFIHQSTSVDWKEILVSTKPTDTIQVFWYNPPPPMLISQDVDVETTDYDR